MALALAIAGGTALLAACAVARRRRPGPLLGAVPDALGDAAFLLDARGRIVAASSVAAQRFGAAAQRGRPVEDLLGAEVALLRKGVGKGPSSGRLRLSGTAPGVVWARAVLARVGVRPVRDLLVVRIERSAPPPLPERSGAPRAGAGLDPSAVGATLLRPLERAATAAGLLRLVLPSGLGSAELQRLEGSLEELERRLRWLRASVGAPREAAAVDLGAMVGELLGGIPSGRARLKAQLAPAQAWVDAARVRMALREVLLAAADALPAGGEVTVRVGPRSGAAFLELASGAAGAGEAAAVARALLAPEGGQVEVEAMPGRGRVCRIWLPGAAEG
ncbi:MAG TPA: hypothetical protein VFG59_10310 [Anaeromyxobacter sp.]|nr:hypothetical protein [Anaeromyxobacter sp.]